MTPTYAALLVAPIMGVISITMPLVLAVSLYPLRPIQKNLYELFETSIIYLVFVYPTIFLAVIPAWLLINKSSLSKWKVLPLIGAGLIGLEFGIMSYLDSYFSSPGFNWEWAVMGILVGSAIGLYAAWILPPKPSTRSG